MTTALGDFENALRNAVAEASKAGVGPLMIVGLLECVKADVRDRMKEAAADRKRHAIVAAGVIPNFPNGHQ